MLRSDSNPAPFSLLRQASLYPALSAKEERRLALAGRAGDAMASERVILCNLRLVVSIARGYSGFGLTLEDFVAAGSTGLIKAAAKFDPDLGFRFATYAAWWVRHAISRALCNQTRIIRLPAHVITRLTRVKQALERMTGDLGREPTQQELAAETGLKPRQLADLFTASGPTVSLNAHRSDEDAAIEDFIVDEQAVDPALELEDKDQVLELHRLLNCRLILTERERLILIARFGIGTEQEEPLKSIGVRLGLTSERVRQLQNHGLAKLRRKLTGDDRNLSLCSNFLD